MPYRGRRHGELVFIRGNVTFLLSESINFDTDTFFKKKDRTLCNTLSNLFLASCVSKIDIIPCPKLYGCWSCESWQMISILLSSTPFIEMVWWRRIDPGQFVQTVSVGCFRWFVRAFGLRRSSCKSAGIFFIIGHLLNKPLQNIVQWWTESTPVVLCYSAGSLCSENVTFCGE